MDTKWWKLKCDLCIYFFGVIVRVRVVFRNTVTCDQALLPLPPSEKKNDRSERKEGLIQLLAKRRVKSPESGLFSDWSKNNSQERAAF